MGATAHLPPHTHPLHPTPTLPTAPPCAMPTTALSAPLPFACSACLQPCSDSGGLWPAGWQQLAALPFSLHLSLPVPLISLLIPSDGSKHLLYLAATPTCRHALLLHPSFLPSLPYSLSFIYSSKEEGRKEGAAGEGGRADGT